MKKILLFLGVVSLFLASCGESEDLSKHVAKVTIIETEVPQEGTNTNYVASITIDGMTCAMGCAKSIEGKLKTMEGVISAEVDFENTVASVEFDQNTTNAENFIAMITSIHDGQYAVTGAKVAKPVKQSEPELEDTEETKNVESSSTENLNISLPSIHVPNILDALMNVL